MGPRALYGPLHSFVHEFISVQDFIHIYSAGNISAIVRSDVAIFTLAVKPKVVDVLADKI
jgi:hypothetical protein